jgi:hypothetical protein
MDRVKVPMHHNYKAAYFSALRDAIFLYDSRDKKAVVEVLSQKEKKKDDEIAFNFRYIS